MRLALHDILRQSLTAGCAAGTAVQTGQGTEHFFHALKFFHRFHDIIIKLHHRTRHQLLAVSLRMREILQHHRARHRLTPVRRLLLPQACDTPAQVTFGYKLVFCCKKAAQTASFAGTAFHIIKLRHFIHGNLLQQVIHIINAVNCQTVGNSGAFYFAAIGSPGHAVRGTGTHIQLMRAAKILQQQSVNLRQAEAAGKLCMMHIY